MTIGSVAGALIARSYSLSGELEADRHGVEILRRVGYSKEVMIDTLTWLMRTPGGGGGGVSSPRTRRRRIESPLCGDWDKSLFARGIILFEIVQY